MACEEKTKYIDVEPKWEDILNEFIKISSIHKHPQELLDQLRPTCRIADIVRQAQKSGKKSVTFTFGAGKTFKISYGT